MTLDSLDALDLALTTFRQHLALVTGDDWAAATPCPDWDVRHLVAHVVGGNRFASMVLNGYTAEQAMTAVMNITQLSAEATVDFDDSVAVQRAGFVLERVLGQNVSHPLGDLTGQRFLNMRVFDVAIHSWDLAVAIGRDGTLDDALTQTVLTIVRRGARHGLRHSTPGQRRFRCQPYGQAARHHRAYRPGWVTHWPRDRDPRSMNSGNPAEVPVAWKHPLYAAGRASVAALTCAAASGGQPVGQFGQ